MKDTLSSLGNNNVVSGYIVHYGKQIESNKETEKYLADAPNYFAWLSVSSEHILYALRMLLYWKTKDKKAFDIPYAELINRCFAEFSFKEDEKEKILLFVRIRHLIVHKGFPNPHEAPSTKNRTISKGEHFTEEDIWKLATKLRTPKAYIELNENFKAARSAISRKNQIRTLSF